MKIGDLIRKMKGINAGKVGVITRVFNESELLRGSKILEVLSEGKFEQWAASWCERIDD
jgi:hypothetical protein